MSGLPSGHNQDVDMDLAQLFRAVWQRKGRLLLATALMAGVAFAGSSLIKPTYRAETTVLIEPRAPNYDAENAKSAASEPVLDELNIASQVQLFRSADLIRQVVRDLKLFEREELDPDLHPSVVSDLMVMLHLKKNPLDLAPEDRVIKTFLDKLQVYQVEKSRVIGIQFSSKDPKLAADVPNAMVKVYLAIQSGAKLDSNQDAARWLEPEIANLRQKVADAEKKVADYRRGSDLLPAGEGSTLASRQLSDVATELSRVRSERATAMARAENARKALASGKPTDNLDIVMASPAVQQLKQAEAAVRAQISDLSTSLLDGHPRIKALKAQLASLNQQLAAETKKVVSSLEADASIAEMREEQLTRQLDTVKADTAKAGEQGVGLAALEREANAQRQLLETYLARYREASSRTDQNASPADARVISRAMPPIEANFPKVIPITVVTALGTFLVGTIGIMLAELFSGRALRPVGPSHPGNGPSNGPGPQTGPYRWRRDDEDGEPAGDRRPARDADEAWGAARAEARMPASSVMAAPTAVAVAPTRSPDRDSGDPGFGDRGFGNRGSIHPGSGDAHAGDQAQVTPVQERNGQGMDGQETHPHPHDHPVPHLDTHSDGIRPDAAQAHPGRDAADAVAVEASDAGQDAPQITEAQGLATVPVGAATTGPDAKGQLTTETPSASDEPENAFSVAAVAHYLTRHGITRALVISPSGDDGSTATVHLARAAATLGQRVILVDMTGSGHPTALMAERQDLPGITDLLCGNAAFGEAIHSDRGSDAHLVPQGTADIRQASYGIDKLALITEALVDAYDLVLVECGPASAENVTRICEHGTYEVVLSAPDPDREQLLAILESFKAAGYDDLLLMSDPEVTAEATTRAVA